MIKMVSDLTKFNWDEVFRMPIIDFFTFVTFQIRYNKEQEEYIKNWKNTN